MPTVEQKHLYYLKQEFVAVMSRFNGKSKLQVIAEYFIWKMSNTLQAEHNLLNRTWGVSIYMFYISALEDCDPVRCENFNCKGSNLHSSYYTTRQSQM